MRTIHDLPQESIEHIIDHLHDDSKTLQACSLTCKSWTDVSQKHLHSSVKFHSGRGKDHGPEAYSTPSVARHVRKLVLSCPPEPTDARPPSRNLWTTVSRMPSIYTLELVNLSWQPCTVAIRNALTSTFGRTVTTLIITTSTFQGADDFLYFLSAFPCLSTLSLSRIEWRDIAFHPGNIRDAALPGKYLKNLQLDWFGSDRMVNDLLEAWVSLFSELLPDAALRLHWSSFAGIGPLASYLHATAPVLAHLRLCINDYDDGVFRAPNLHLEHCTQLQTIEFMALCDMSHHSDLTYHDEWRGDNNWVRDVLSQVRSNRVMDVILRLRARTKEDLVLLDFGSVDEVLQATHFREAQFTVSLSRTFLGARAAEVKESVVAELEKMLSNAFKRGKLRFELVA